jgi:gluconolactonase
MEDTTDGHSAKEISMSSRNPKPERDAQQAAERGHSRRGFLGRSVALAMGALARPAFAQSSAPFVPSARYPDPAVVTLDNSFLKYRLFNASVERLATGFRWLEGPVWVGDGRYLLASDIPNNRIIRWDESTGQLSVFRQPSNFSNGLARDRQGRLLTCEGATTLGLGRRIARTEYNGRITVIADRFEGKPFNSPNDLVCKSDGSIWFSDPPFQAINNYEGRIATTELPQAVYRVDDKTGKVTRVIDNLLGPNGLCFSPDEKKLYVVEGRVTPNRLVWAYDVDDQGRLGNRTKVIEAFNFGALDGIKCDADGNLWCGWGSSGALGGKPEELDGVMVFNPQGKPIGHIRLPERCANLCFGGAEGNQLFMASSHSLYALFVNTRGADVR